MENKTKDLTKVSLGIALMFLIYWIYIFFISDHLTFSPFFKNIISIAVLYIIGLAVFIFISKDVTNNDYKKGKVEFKNLLTCFFLQFFALLAFMLITAIIVTFGKETVTERDNLSYDMLFSLLVFAPIVEELVFRDIFAKKLLKYGESFFILVSAFCFSIIHGVAIGFPTIIYTFILGLIWAYLLVKTGNVWIPIIYHSLSNLFGGILPQIILSFKEQLFPIYFLLIIVFAIMGLILLFINRKDFSFEVKVFSKENIKILVTNKGIIFLTIATISFMLIKNLVL